MKTIFWTLMALVMISAIYITGFLKSAGGANAEALNPGRDAYGSPGTISLGADPTCVAIGTATQLYATLSTAAPSVSVSFYADSSLIGSAYTNSSGTASISYTPGSVGNHTCQATSSGYTNSNTVNVLAVGVLKVIVKNSSPQDEGPKQAEVKRTGTTTCSFALQAIPNPSGSFPTNNPVWSYSGKPTGSSATFSSNTGSETTPILDKVGQYTVTATCGTSSDSFVINAVYSIDVTTDKNTLILGENLKITYTVRSAFNSVNVNVKNSGGVTVAQWTGQSGAVGDHDITWEKGTWNTGAHSGAFANPKNSNYAVEATGVIGGSSVDTATKSINTKLVVEFDVKDTLPAGGTATRVSGLSDLGSVLSVGFKLGGSTTSFNGTSLTITDVAGSATSKQKHVKIDVTGLNNLSSGNYSVNLNNLRDAIGNFSDNDNDPSNGVQPLSFTLDLE